MVISGSECLCILLQWLFGLRLLRWCCIRNWNFEPVTTGAREDTCPYALLHVGIWRTLWIYSSLSKDYGGGLNMRHSVWCVNGLVSSIVVHVSCHSTVLLSSMIPCRTWTVHINSPPQVQRKSQKLLGCWGPLAKVGPMFNLLTCVLSDPWTDTGWPITWFLSKLLFPCEGVCQTWACAAYGLWWQIVVYKSILNSV